MYAELMHRCPQFRFRNAVRGGIPRDAARVEHRPDSRRAGHVCRDKDVTAVVEIQPYPLDGRTLARERVVGRTKAAVVLRVETQNLAHFPLGHAYG